MKKLYATVGIFKLISQNNKKVYPSVILSGKECKLDVQEMMVWASLNWRILTREQLSTYYEEQDITSNNIADYTRNLPATRPVITAISNLYLRQQILFERMV